MRGEGMAGGGANELTRKVYCDGGKAATPGLWERAITDEGRKEWGGDRPQADK